MNKYPLLLLALLLTVAVAVAETPQETPIDGLVNDYAAILGPQEEAALQAQLQSLYDSGAVQYAIVTINSLEGMDSFGYATQISEGIVGDSQTNNGLVLLVAVDDREYRYLTGRGLEPVLPDIILSRIASEYLVPHFKQEDYATGIIESTKAIVAVVENDTDSSYYAAPPRGMRASPILAFLLNNPFLIFAAVFLIFTLARKDKHKRNDEDLLTGLLLGSMMSRGRGRGGLGGGGFGGFGGGSFGGGGAGGGW